jgi:hypothetical protein
MNVPICGGTAALPDTLRLVLIDHLERMPRRVTRKLQEMSGKAGTGGVKLAAEIGGMVESGNGFASELVNSGGFGEKIG